jgi:ribonucleoside-diphosphate reductase beta chain
MPLFHSRIGYKPFEYPWAYEACVTQQRIHWLPEEVSLADDVMDWNTRLTASEKNLLSNIFRFFTQADIDVSESYLTAYLNVFKPTEIRMMLTSFANMETVHIAAYSYLMETIGMPDSEYNAFMNIKEMSEKHLYLKNSIDDLQNEITPHKLAILLATYGAFCEGMQLFASFAILLSFQRFGKMKGMGQIISWSIRDETLHCKNMIKLFHEYRREYERDEGFDFLPEITTPIYEACKTMVLQEDRFIDIAFDGGKIDGLEPESIKEYIRYIADIRLRELGLRPLFNVSRNPIPWLESIVNGVDHTNFFDNKVTEYSKASTSGKWEDIWS